MGILSVHSLGTSDILARIPHRHPMVLIDRMEEVRWGVSGKGVKCVTYSEGFFQGHFPDEPIFPGVLIVECMAQTAAIVLSDPDGTHSGRGRIPRYLAKINSLKFLRPVRPGDQLEIEVAIRRRLGSMVVVGALARVCGEEAASGELVLAG